MRFLSAIEGAPRILGSGLWTFSTRPRNLARDLRRQSNENYWRQRERSRSRALRLVALRYRLSLFAVAGRDSVAIFQGIHITVLKALALGGLLLGAVYAAEGYLSGHLWSWLVPSEPRLPPFGAFPTLAVRVSASLPGFYLASLSIVLSTSYDDVSHRQAERSCNRPDASNTRSIGPVRVPSPAAVPPGRSRHVLPRIADVGRSSGAVREGPVGTRAGTAGPLINRLDDWRGTGLAMRRTGMKRPAFGVEQ